MGGNFCKLETKSSANKKKFHKKLGFPMLPVRSKMRKRFCLTIYKNVPLVPRKGTIFARNFNKTCTHEYVESFRLSRRQNQPFIYSTPTIWRTGFRVAFSTYSSLNIFCNTCCNKLNVFLFFPLFVEILS